MMEEARQFIAANSLKNVTLEGFVEGAKKDQLISRAQLVVVPSEWNEPFPTVVPEAYAHGKSVLASRMGGLLEMIEPGKTGDFFEVSPNDAESAPVIVIEVISSMQGARR